jgi:hypothetical protein
VYHSYEIVTAKPDGSDVQRLTQNDAYDAEATVCPKDGSILFTSDRDGDLELYRMDRDGKNVKRLTTRRATTAALLFGRLHQDRLAGGACQEPEEAEESKRLLADQKVRPGALEIYVANADGSDARQVTYLGAASFAPFFFPSGNRILFSSNYGDPKGREFDIWAIDTNGNAPRAHHLHGGLRWLPDVLAGRQAARLRLQPPPGRAARDRHLRRRLERRAERARRRQPLRRRRLPRPRPRSVSRTTSPGSPTTRARAAASASRVSTRPRVTSRSAFALSASSPRAMAEPSATPSRR